jgi:hypothetical protein
LEVGVNVSITPGDDDLRRRLEPDTPTYTERWKFVEELKNVGLWVGLKCEPLISGVNDETEMLREYAKNACILRVNHVNFGDYRIHSVHIAARRLASAGYDLAKIMKTKKETWVDKGREFFEILKRFGLKVSCPDWINFGMINDCESCCGFPDDIFPHHKFTFQHAIKILSERDRVYFKELAIHNIFGEEYLRKFREIWNGKEGYFNLGDVTGIRRVGWDGDGDVIYGKSKGLKGVFS